MKLTATAALLLAAALPATAQVILTETYTFNVGGTAGAIADTGVASVFSQTISGSQIASLTAVRVGLHLTGTTAGAGWAGDLFVSLNRDLGSQTAVLLNQVGVSGGDPAGFGHDGWNVTFRDDATANGDVHLGQPVGPATQLTGEWQPDGRLSPTDSLRPALLGVFTGTAADARWLLTLADLSAGGLMGLESWSLTLEGTGFAPVPEPAATAALTGAALAAFAAWRRSRSVTDPCGEKQEKNDKAEA